MSYILDALRKADAERERDPARGIHAQPAVSPVVPEGASRRRWALVAGGGLVVMVIVAMWQWRGTVPASPSPSAMPSAVMPVPTAPAPITPAVLVMQPPAPATEVRPPAPPPLPAPAVAARPPSPAAPAAAPTAPLAPTPLPVTTVAAAPAPASSAAAVPDRILNVAELPPDVARDLPRLAISGGVYSPNPAQRMLIVAGQVVNEGAEIAPGLKLEEIRAKTAVLKFRGLRYSVAY